MTATDEGEATEVRQRPPFSWYGGKTSHLKWLLPIIGAVPHRTFVEPFGGSAAVLLNKEPSPVEVYNDLFGDVVNFFRVLRDEGGELIRRVRLTPYSRAEFAAACEGGSPDRVERARQFFVVARQVRTGLATTASEGRWAYVTRDSRRGMPLVVSRYLAAVEGLEAVVERLRAVQIENAEGVDCLLRYDTPESLHYVDPPYLMATRPGGRAYRHEMTEGEHRRLLDCLRALKGRVVLSGYRNDVYDSALAGWDRIDADAKLSASTRRNGTPTTRQESVWTNFTAPPSLFDAAGRPATTGGG